VHLFHVEVFDDPLAGHPSGQDDGDGGEHRKQPPTRGQGMWNQADRQEHADDRDQRHERA